MWHPEICDKILFISMVCSSFFIILYNISVNKTALSLKSLGLVFIVPFGLCCSIFVFTADTSLCLMLSLSELCLSVGIFLVLLLPGNPGNYRGKAFIISSITVALALYIIKSETFIYYSLSANVRNIITAVFIAAAVYANGRMTRDQKLLTPLSLWLISILLGFFADKQYVKEAVVLTKLGVYISFSYYFYKAINSEYIKKINESKELAENMERSLNKEVKRRVLEIERSNERLLQISKTDLLTGSYNKATILNIIERLVSNKRVEVFSILMFDIDNFKTINDSYGHITGDLCLKTLGNIASGNIREVDHLGRYGGDEFIIVLPNLPGNEARFVAERFRKKVSETDNPKFTVSIGIATYPDNGETVKDLISAADRGLYNAKKKGKNSVSQALQF